MNKFYYISKATDPQYDLPSRGTKNSAGYDLHSPVSFTLKPGETIKISLGIKCEINEGEFLMIVPRSSVGFKYHIVLDNTCGIVDADYYNNPDNEGEIFAKLTNQGNQNFIVNSNDRILQAIFVKYDLTDDDKTTSSREGGLGSTGK